MTETGGVGALLKRALGERKWNQADLAREAGLDEGTVSDVVNETRWPRITTQAKIEDALGMARGTLARTRAGDPVGPGQQDRRGAVPNIPDEVTKGMSPEQLAEWDARMVAEAWKARREVMGGT